MRDEISAILGPVDGLRVEEDHRGWLIRFGFHGHAMAGHTAMDPQTPDDPRDLARRMRDAMMAHPALQQEESHAVPEMVEPEQSGESDNRGAGDADRGAAGEPAPAEDVRDVPRDGDSGGDSIRAVDSSGAVSRETIDAADPTPETTVIVEPVDAHFSEPAAPDDSEAPESTAGRHGGMMINDLLSELSAHVDSLAKARIAACDDNMRAINMGEINNARMMGLLTAEQEDAEGRYYLADRRRIALAAFAGEVKRSLADMTPARLAAFSVDQIEWPKIGT